MRDGWAGQTEYPLRRQLAHHDTGTTAYGPRRNASTAGRRHVWIAGLLYAALAGIAPIKGGIGPLQLLLVALLPAMIPTIFASRFLKIMWGCGLVWTIGQVLVNHEHGLSMVASAAIVMLLVCLHVTGLVWLQERLSMSAIAVIGFCVLGWFILAINTGALSTENPWKFGLGEATIPLAFICVGGSRSWVRQLVALLVIAAVSLASDSRSLLGFALLALIWAFIRSRLNPRHGGRALVAIVCVLAAGYASYPHLASAGALGKRAQEQQVQYSVDHANWLMANRREVPQLWYLTRTYLPTGVGTYGPINQATAEAALGAVARAAGPLTPEDDYYLLHDVDTMGYHAHSQFFASTLYGGFIPVAFWVFLFVAAGSGLVNTRTRQGPYQVAWVFILLNVLWNSFFSPMDETTASSITAALLVCFQQLRATLPRDENRSQET